jgi:hypothetical protein
MRLLMFVLFGWLCACVQNPSSDDSKTSTNDMTIDPNTGIPYAYTFTFPVEGFDTSDFGFGYGSENRRFCLERNSQNQCIAYGYHLGRDTVVSKTPVGTEVVAPGDGIVRLTTDKTYGGYGSDTSSNPSYRGCLIALEHEFANGQPVLTILGHVKCESSVAYDPEAKKGNPPVGALVRRGQYVAHVEHYWAGSGTSMDWHHIHWAMRKGPFSSLAVGEVVKGYAKKSEFEVDSSTGAFVHPSWLDPFLIVAANGDPAAQAAANVRHHPSGALLEDPLGSYWFVSAYDALRPLSQETFGEAHFDPARAIRVSDEEIGCYHEHAPFEGEGSAVLYKRPDASTVVMAYPEMGIRYDVIRWEALLSWGYDGSELITDADLISHYETTLDPAGFRLLRPGTLVKAEEQTEVAVVSAAQTRQPIASGDVFLALGYRWEDIISIPQSVLSEVAGPRESTLVDAGSIHACVVPSGCTSCGGGGVADEICNGEDDDADGSVDEDFLCVVGSLGNVCVTDCNTAGLRICEAPSCSWGACEPYSENCENTIDDDCNGQVDCADSTCAGTSSCTSSPDDLTTITFNYVGPVSSGAIALHAWWQPPNAPTRSWGLVSECVDMGSGDGILQCSFSVPSETSPFVFQITLPDGRFWGDLSCTPTGGCGSTVGSVVVSAAGALSVDLVPNNANGDPYMNGSISFIP